MTDKNQEDTEKKMNQNIDNKENAKPQETEFSAADIDTLGEIGNIFMGSFLWVPHQPLFLLY